MDPISFAASIAALATLAFQVSQSIQSYSKAVKNASESVLEIDRDVGALSAVLTQLVNLLQNPQMQRSFFAQSSILAVAVQACNDKIAMIAAKLQKMERDGIGGVWERMKWPFKEKEVQSLADALRKYTATFQFCLTIEGCELMSQSSEIAIRSLQIQLETSQQVFELTRDVAFMSGSAKEASKLSTQLTQILQLASTVSQSVDTMQSFSANMDVLLLKSRSDEQMQILEWLAPASWSQKHHDRVGRRISGTGQWLLDCEVFKSWLDQSQPLLWCSGDPGVGKSVLASLVIDHVVSTSLPPDGALGYFYFDYQEHDLQTSVFFVRSLLRQFAAQKKPFYQPLMTMYQSLRKEHVDDQYATLCSVLKELLGTFKRCFLIIDALDECAVMQHRKRVLSFLESLDLRNISIMTTSRPHFQDISEHHQHAIHVNVRASDQDIKSYCHHAIEQDQNICRLADDKLKETVADTIASRSQGMFLLAVLHMQSILDSMTKSELKKQLRDLSTDLSQAYERTLLRINKESRNRCNVAKKALMWVLHAQRPLQVSELCHALATEIGEAQFDFDNLLQSKLILECCYGFLVIDEESSNIRLVHFTLRDYLLSLGSNQRVDEQTLMARTLLTYLCFEDGHPGLQVSENVAVNEEQQLILLEYAASHWGHHAEVVPAKDLKELVLRFFSNPRNMRRAAQAQNQIQPATTGNQPNLLSKRINWTECMENFSGLQLLASFGLSDLLKIVLEEGFDVDALDNNGNTALHAAALSGRVQATKVLLNHGATLEVKNADSNTPLYLAASNSHAHIATELLQRGADANAKCKDLWTPLHKAADRGGITVVQVLLEHGASTRAESARRLIPLHRASGKGHLNIMKLLLKHKGLANARTWDGWTPLHGACISGQHEAVELLISYGASIDAQSADFCTPLHRACWSGHLRTSEVLLEHGANHLIQDSRGEIPLHAAAKEGRQSIIHPLLYHDRTTLKLQLLSRNNFVRTPREEAAYRGHWEVAALLRAEEVLSIGFQCEQQTNLEAALLTHELPRVAEIVDRGADIDERGSDGLPPLHHALLLGDEPIAEYLCRKGANLSAQALDGWQPLHCAAKQGLCEMVILFSEKGASIEARTGDGQTPLHKACKSGSAALVLFLLEKGADVGARDDFGWTPLHTASAAGFKEIVVQLLAYGADLDATDDKGRTVHACAAQTGQHNIVEYIRGLHRGGHSGYGWPQKVGAQVARPR